MNVRRNSKEGVRGARTRDAILVAALKSYYSDPDAAPLTAERLMAEAGISRGTFYKYFASMQEVENALGQRLAEDTVVQLRLIVEVSGQGPVLRAALGALALMAHGAFEPSWGRFVTRADHIFPSSGMTQAMRHTLLEGRQLGHFTFTSTNVATEFTLGVAMEGVRKLMRGMPHPIAFMCEMTKLMLRGLGIDNAEAERVALEGYAILQSIGTTHLAWWRDEGV